MVKCKYCKNKGTIQINNWLCTDCIGKIRGGQNTVFYNEQKGITELIKKNF